MHISMVHVYTILYVQVYILYTSFSPRLSPLASTILMYDLACVRGEAGNEVRYIHVCT